VTEQQLIGVVFLQAYVPDAVQTEPRLLSGEGRLPEAVRNFTTAEASCTILSFQPEATHALIAAAPLMLLAIAHGLGDRVYACTRI